MRYFRAFVVLVAATALYAPVRAAAAGAAADDDPSVSPMRSAIDRYAADRGSIGRYFRSDIAPSYRERLGRFYEERNRQLQAIDFDKLDQAGRIDYLLLRNDIAYQPRQLRHQQKEFYEAAPLLPFAQAIFALEEARRAVPDVDAQGYAKTLTEIARQVKAAREPLEQKLKSGEQGKKDLPSPVLANRAARMTDELRDALKRWHGFYSGYDPEFTWWMREPYPKADKALEEYASFLRKKLAGFPERDGEDEPVIGDPIGREALLDALENEFIPYTPEELIEIADKEFAWCEGEMKRVADDLGCDGDWKKALDKVSEKHVRPGEQPKLIKQLADEATRFVEERQLVTVPELCKQSWRIEMMPPDRQKVNPYFTGGAVISVSYPTDSMTYEDKQMSMRGNNPSFCRATVHHELIPGHHLQGFVGDRFNTHRKLFRTPFLIEGWPLYWEMLLWDQGFPRTAEDRVGMLFWRVHRSARIVFSLKFHLGQMTPQQAIDLLVDRVGHERRNATAEVRRSVNGSYEPLYQAAYLLGGLQIRGMRKELVESGKMTDRQFHDAILRENAIPVTLIRASLTGQKLTRDFKSDWRFYGDAAAKGQAAKPADSAPVVAAAGRPRVYRDKVEPHWLPGNKQFWYRNDLRGGAREFVLVDAEKGTRTPGFDPASVAPAADAGAGKLAPTRTPRPSRAGRSETEVTFVNETDKEVQLFWSDTDGNRQPYGALEPGTRKAQHTFAGHVWVAAARDGEVLAVFEAADQPALAVIDGKAPRGDAGDAGDVARQFADMIRRRREGGRRERLARSPDEKWEAFVRDDNLWLREVESGKESALTTDAGARETYSRDTYRDRAEGGGGTNARPEPPSTVPEVYWSPDSKKLVAIRTRRAPGHTVYLIESSPKDQVQPRLHSFPYLKPGDEIPVQKPRLFDVEARKEIPVKDELFPAPWSVGEFRWAGDSSRFTFLYNQRGHQVLRIVAVDARSGEAKPVVDEKSETFVDYSGKKFSEYLDDTGEIVWMSERDGWNHLYVYDAKTGQVKNQITKGEWVVRSVDRVDKEKRQVWFQAGGIRPEQDPYHVHHCRVNLDGTGLVVLTEGDGTHAVQFSPDRRFFIDTWSRVDLPPVNELRRSDDGSLVCKLEEADAGDVAGGGAGRSFPERFVAKGRDGATDIYGIIHRPRSFDPSRKYPIIESIYAGPQSGHVPKSFRASSRQQELADRGFIIVQIDGMGTSQRSKKFHDVCWKNLGDAGFPDRIPWMKAAAQKYPQMDLSRVGIYGGSAGGQNALGGLLLHGDFYKAAVADCGCHDNRMDKIWWNEQWMGYPVGPQYAEQSNVTLAPRLEGKLLLIVGELDRNVDPASTMQVVNALVKADKDFDLLVVPGANHGAGGGPYGQRRTTDFFVRHLLNGGREAPVTPSAVGAAQ